MKENVIKKEEFKKILKDRDELMEALEELIDIIDDRDARSEIDSFTSQHAKEVLNRIKV